MTKERINDQIMRLHSDPNVYQVRVPLAETSLGCVNCYVIESEGETLVIDAGFDDATSREAVLAAFATLNVDVSRTSLLFTHFHSDHTGAPDLLPPDRPRYIGEVDYECAAELPRHGRTALKGLLLREGVPEQTADRILRLFLLCVGDMSRVRPTTLRDGDVLHVGPHAFRVLHTPGHTPGHICLHHEGKGLLFAGDHVLFDISPNICHLPGHPHMLERFIGSLERIASLPVSECLVAHRGNGDGRELRRRVDELVRHHDGRSSGIMGLLESNSEGLTAFEVTRLIPWKAGTASFGDLRPMEVYFAQSETMAHLEMLEASGAVIRRVEGGTARYILKNARLIR